MIEYAYSLAVTSAPIIEEFPIAAGTVIEKGEVVKLVEGFVVAVGDTDQDDPYLGVSAEEHTGTASLLNPRSNGNKIKVYCSPLAVFKCKPGIISTATGGNTTTWVDSGFTDPADDKFNGGLLKVRKSATLTNGVGKWYTVTDFTKTTGTFTGAFTGGVSVGDQALVLPPVGSFGWDLNSDGTNLNFAANGGESIMIVRVDPEQELVYFILRLHQFGNTMVAV
ncbi:hypothetical protein [Cohnella sp. JJ-181]|uniref:hypothetical protein n=1 Tax=Cohnella rhizoplanae TaxID=2974897 RepID=UPI0022FF5013|nr:hypothetical protein [Cohnella sp. JJ-181]CAI6073573.1 hypothetical protein COHCIP112018_02391 [Cohnella sp. JJ-181]